MKLEVKKIYLFKKIAPLQLWMKVKYQE